MSGFFISYQRNNKKFAFKMRDKLADEGIQYWIDEHIRSGEEWKQIIDKEIADCVGVIVIVTPNALRSQYVTYEWSYALGLGKRVIPAIFEFPNPDPKSPDHLIIHPKLDDRQRRDFSNPRKQPWGKLIDDLREMITKDDIPFEIADAEKKLYDSNPNVRREGSQFLLTHPHHLIGNIFAKAAQNASPDIAVDAGFALAEKSNYKDVRAIIGLRRGIEKHPKRNDVLSTLVSYECPETVEVFKNALEQATDENFRIIIVKYLCQINHKDAIPVLRTLVKTTGNLYGNVVDALCKSPDLDSLPELLIIARRTDIGMKSRTNAIAAIGKISSIEILDELYSIVNSLKGLHSREDQEVFEAVLNAFTSIDEQKTIDLLIQLQNDHRFSNYMIAMRAIIRNIQVRITQ